MPVFIAMLRGVNVGGHNMIRMEALRTLCGSLELREAQTYVQSGNIIFKTSRRDAGSVAKLLEDGIEKTFGFRPVVVIRTPAEMRDVLTRNPFAARPEVEPGKLIVTFLARDPGAAGRQKVLGIKTDPEELRIEGRELYVYFPNGMGKSKLSPSVIEKALGTPGTGRNWNSVTKLLELAEKL